MVCLPYLMRRRGVSVLFDAAPRAARLVCCRVLRVPARARENTRHATVPQIFDAVSHIVEGGGTAHAPELAGAAGRGDAPACPSVSVSVSFLELYGEDIRWAARAWAIICIYIFFDWLVLFYFIDLRELELRAGAGSVAAIC